LYLQAPNALTEADMQKEKNQTHLDGSGTLTTPDITRFFTQHVYAEGNKDCR
jgi:hypothetical protein